MDNRKEIVKNIITVLTNRRGFDDLWCNLDEEIQSEITDEIVNILPMYDVIQSDYLCDRECSGENKCDEQCYVCADMEMYSP